MAAQALEQSVLESKDKEQLLAIAKALGLKATARTKKADIIGQILETTGPSGTNGNVAPATTSGTTTGPSADTATTPTGRTTGRTTTVEPATEPVDEPPAEWEVAAGEADADERGATGDGAGETTSERSERPQGREAATRDDQEPRAPRDRADDQGDQSRDQVDQSRDQGDQRDQRDQNGQRDQTASATSGGQHRGQGNQGSQGGQNRSQGNQNRTQGGQNRSQGGQATQGGQSHQGGGGNQGSDDGDGRSRKRRRRRKNKGGDGPQGEDRELLETTDDEPVSNEPVEVGGYLDLRDEGYGFLRVKGYLPHRDDAYVPLKMSRQYGLRKGDHVTGISRPAARNEKNPALMEIHTVNGAPPDAAKKRPRFEDLTALFPDQRLHLENPDEPTDMTARIIDLVAPIGKGQRGIIVSPPKAGKTTIMKTIVSAIERNNPEVKVMVLLIDERPEEVTDMRRTVKGEVVSSTFDRPSDEHTIVAEMTIERAKRMVEQGEDVVVVLDGITRLSRAYNLAAPASGRILSGGIDAGALYPPKKFFGAARNVEEGGSLTILATALVETNSRMDDAIFEEFKGTGNMELRLDRKLAERRIYPAIDVDASSTRHEELLFDRKQLQMVWKLRRVLSGLAADGNAAPGLELLIDRLKTFRTNDEFLNEIAKQPSM